MFCSLLLDNYQSIQNGMAQPLGDACLHESIQNGEQKKRENERKEERGRDVSGARPARPTGAQSGPGSNCGTRAWPKALTPTGSTYVHDVTIRIDIIEEIKCSYFLFRDYFLRFTKLIFVLKHHQQNLKNTIINARQRSGHGLLCLQKSTTFLREEKTLKRI